MTDPISSNFQVNYRYEVHFTHGVFHSDNPLLRTLLSRENLPIRTLAAVDEGLARSRPLLSDEIVRYCLPFSDRIHVVVLQAGESNKNTIEGLHELYRLIAQKGICRHSFILAVGGGALLDLVGFAAATAHRGVRLIRIPTTTLSQADSGVGVKNGMNFEGKKNFIGSFAPPFAVVNDFEMLATLPDLVKRSGYAEAVKVGLIRDRFFFDEIEAAAPELTRFEPQSLQWIIRRCAEGHANHIASGGDPFETGSSRPLDFGHWSAHKLETMSQFRLSHGEAVAIGIAIDVAYSVRIGLLDEDSAERIFAVLEKLGFSLCASELSGMDVLLGGLEDFREHLGGELTIMLLEEIGTATEVHAIDCAKMKSAIRFLRRRQTGAPRPRRSI
jgi:3-dehydroquinate synthase